MASYLSPQIDYNQFAPILPQTNIELLAKVLENKQMQYNTNLNSAALSIKSMKDMETELPNALLRDQVKEFNKQAEEQVKKFANADFSLSENVSKIRNIYKPVTENKTIIKSLNAASSLKNEIKLGESYKASSKETDRNAYNPVSIEYLQNSLDFLENAKDIDEINFTIDKYGSRKYLPNTDIFGNKEKMLKDLNISTTKVVGLNVNSAIPYDINNPFIISVENGQQIIQPLTNLIDVSYNSSELEQIRMNNIVAFERGYKNSINKTLYVKEHLDNISNVLDKEIETIGAELNNVKNQLSITADNNYKSALESHKKYLELQLETKNKLKNTHDDFYSDEYFNNYGSQYNQNYQNAFGYIIDNLSHFNKKFITDTIAKSWAELHYKETITGSDIYKKHLEELEAASGNTDFSLVQNLNDIEGTVIDDRSVTTFVPDNEQVFDISDRNSYFQYINKRNANNIYNQYNISSKSVSKLPGLDKIVLNNGNVSFTDYIFKVAQNPKFKDYNLYDLVESNEDLKYIYEQLQQNKDQLEKYGFTDLLSFFEKPKVEKQPVTDPILKNIEKNKPSILLERPNTESINVEKIVQKGVERIVKQELNPKDKTANHFIKKVNEIFANQFKQFVNNDGALNENFYDSQTLESFNEWYTLIKNKDNDLDLKIKEGLFKEIKKEHGTTLNFFFENDDNLKKYLSGEITEKDLKDKYLKKMIEYEKKKNKDFPISINENVIKRYHNYFDGRFLKLDSTIKNYFQENRDNLFKEVHSLPVVYKNTESKQNANNFIYSAFNDLSGQITNMSSSNVYYEGDADDLDKKVEGVILIDPKLKDAIPDTSNEDIQDYTKELVSKLIDLGLVDKVESTNNGERLHVKFTNNTNISFKEKIGDNITYTKSNEQNVYDLLALKGDNLEDSDKAKKQIISSLITSGVTLFNFKSNIKDNEIVNKLQYKRQQQGVISEELIIPSKNFALDVTRIGDERSYSYKLHQKGKQFKLDSTDNTYTATMDANGVINFETDDIDETVTFNRAQLNAFLNNNKHKQYELDRLLYGYHSLAPSTDSKENPLRKQYYDILLNYFKESNTAKIPKYIIDNLLGELAKQKNIQ